MHRYFINKFGSTKSAKGDFSRSVSQQAPWAALLLKMKQVKCKKKPDLADQLIGGLSLASIANDADYPKIKCSFACQIIMSAINHLSNAFLSALGTMRSEEANGDQKHRIFSGYSLIAFPTNATLTVIAEVMKKQMVTLRSGGGTRAEVLFLADFLSVVAANVRAMNFCQIDMNECFATDTELGAFIAPFTSFVQELDVQKNNLDCDAKLRASIKEDLTILMSFM